MAALFENVYEFGMGFISNGYWKEVVMWLIGAVLIYLAIAKDMEPSLLLPIGFGAILMNLPGVELHTIEVLFRFGISEEFGELLRRNILLL